MTRSTTLSRFSQRLVSRRGSWTALILAVAVVVGVFGLTSGTGSTGSSSASPPSSQSAQVANELREFPGAERQAVLVVATRTDARPLSAADVDALRALAADVVPGAAGHAGPALSTDGLAATITVPLAAPGTGGTDSVASVRAYLATAAPRGMTLQVTGGPAFAADIAAAFDGADLTLLLVTILIVALLLIATYRSPILWLLPLTVVALADGVAGRVTAAVGSLWDLQFDAGVVSVLVFGAGTNYALLLISRYREELGTTADHRHALSTAWRRTAPAIVASNVTVVLALLTLALAVTPGTRGLGVASAIGLVITVLAVLLALPALLAVCGRRVFWPRVPSPGQVRQARGRWRSIATAVMARPVASLVAGLTLLAIMTAGLIGTSVGLDQFERFRVESESAAGLGVLAAHFPPGQAQPILIVADTASAESVRDAVASLDGIDRVVPVSTSADRARTELLAVSDFVPSSEQSLAQVFDVRQAVLEVPGANALVGGAVAADVDARAANQRDLLLLAPIIIVECLLILALLLRSILAPLLLVAVNVASAVAAIGAGAWLSGVLLDQPALDLPVPLLAFLFLIALGIDYTIFLTHRARAEARTLGTRAGMIESLSHTGAVITSAGIVLAAVFAALGVLPLVTLGQLGLIVGVGVLVDTLVVRTTIVPAIFGLLGERLWWPGPIPHRPAQLTHEPGRPAPVPR